MSAYLTASAATTIANALPGLASFKAANDATKDAALELASERFDTARRYQGRKYLTDGTQALEFPRVAYESMSTDGYGSTVSVSGTIWDWDVATNAAIVPTRVKRAVVYEADSIIAGSRAARMDAQHDGLTAQSIGSASESYADLRGKFGEDGIPVLCSEADRISRQYKLRQGKLL